MPVAKYRSTSARHGRAGAPLRRTARAVVVPVVVATAVLLGDLAASAPVASASPVRRRCDALVVGDSILRDAVDVAGLARRFSAGRCPVEVDAQPGRSTTGAADAVVARAAARPLPSVVVVTSSGWDSYTDPAPVAANVDRVMAAAAGRRVVWVNSFVNSPAAHDQQVNATLAGKARQYRNLRVVNHWGWMNTHRQYLRDGLAHLTPAGSVVWTGRLLVAVRGY